MADSANSAAAASISLPWLTGPLLFGTLSSYALFGILIMQMTIYHLSFPNDPRYIKLFVLAVLIIELGLMTLVTYLVWYIFIDGYSTLSNPGPALEIAHLLAFDPTSPAQPPLTGLMTSLFHAFYSWRIWKLTKKYYVPVAIVLMSIVQFFLGICFGVYFGTHGARLQSLQTKYIDIILTSWFSFTTAADFLVTGSMITILVKARNSTNYTPTVNKLQKVIRFTVETGFLTTFVSLVDVVTFRVWGRTNYVHLYFFIVLSKIYSNTFMANLNSRIIFNKTMSTFSGGQSVRTDGDLPIVFWRDVESSTSSLPFGGETRLDLGGSIAHSRRSPLTTVYVHTSHSVSRDHGTSTELKVLSPSSCHDESFSQMGDKV